MRRIDRELTETKDIIEIIEKNKVLRMAMADGKKPYVVPLNYGYTFEDGKLTFYIHCAREGRKLDILKENNNICFETDCEHELIEAEKACGYGYRFASVIGEGTCSIVEDREEKIKGLSLLMKHQTGSEKAFSFEAVDKVVVCKLEIAEFSGKAHR